jgi:hydrogenase maturation factor
MILILIKVFMHAGFIMTIIDNAFAYEIIDDKIIF